MYPFGSIVLARFPFTDLSADKRRPALVVSVLAEADDVILCFITSVGRNGPAIVPISADAITGLKRPSFVRFDKIATLNTTLVTGTVGIAPHAWLQANADRFYAVFGFALDRQNGSHGPVPKAL